MTPKMTIHPVCAHQAHPRFCVPCADESPEMVPRDFGEQILTRGGMPRSLERPGDDAPPMPAHACPRPTRLQRIGSALAWALLGFAAAWFLAPLLAVGGWS